MNRDIEFRGLTGSVKGDIWVYGTPYKVESLFSADERYYIRNKHADERIVDPKTIGQYTGLKDKNGKKIFEGDIVLINGKHTDEVIFECGCFLMKKQLYNYEFTYQNFDNLEVIGNIYENKELLEV